MAKNLAKLGILAVLVTGFVGCQTLTITNNKTLENTNVESVTNEDIDEKREKLLNEAEKLKNSYYVDEAIELLNTNSSLMNNDLENKINEYKSYKDSFVKYEGNVEHIFFHSLIVYPELAFDDKGHPAEGYNMWFTTVDEFKKMLPKLKDKGYVLVKITDLFGKDENGKMVKKDIYLPKGKKPLVISQDDVNYYDYMKIDGFANKLVFDKDGNIATEIINKNGNTEVTRNGDIVPILDDYVAENPEFSYKGAKGVLAVTGYEGVLGYRLTSEENKKNAMAVADKLKENGWLFASHSYTHNGDGYFYKSEYSKLDYDFSKWKNTIEPIVGKTNVYISPFGVTLPENYFDLVGKYGFDIYCNVARMEQSYIKNNYAIMPRFNLDGMSFENDKTEIKNRFFDVSTVIDEKRPSL